MELESNLLNFVIAYREVRGQFVRQRWSTLCSMILRATPYSHEFDRLLREERDFQERMREWLSGLALLKSMSRDDMERMKCTLKNYKERVSSRRLFLLLFAALLAISATFYSSLETLTGQAQSIVLGMVNGMILIFATFEQQRIINEAGVAEECANLLELAIKTGLGADEALKPTLSPPPRFGEPAA